MGLSPCRRMVYGFLSTFITSGMRFLLNQQVWAVAGLGCSGGDLSFSKALTLAPTSQICPVLHHAGMVLLNSLLDTVPGELVPAGRELWTRPWPGMG